MSIATLRRHAWRTTVACWLTIAASAASAASAATVAKAASADGAGQQKLPPNLSVPGQLRPLLEEALERSPTFREEIDLLRRTPRVRVTIRYGDLSIWHQMSAESLLHRYEFGAMMVETELYTLRDVVEVVAHELAHVCEAIEGVDLRALADRPGSGVRHVTARHYETRYAVETGLRVARETRDETETEAASMTPSATETPSCPEQEIHPYQRRRR